MEVEILSATDTQKISLNPELLRDPIHIDLSHAIRELFYLADHRDHVLEGRYAQIALRCFLDLIQRYPAEEIDAATTFRISGLIEVAA